jgi:hypothetical protein
VAIGSRGQEALTAGAHALAEALASAAAARATRALARRKGATAAQPNAHIGRVSAATKPPLCVLAAGVSCACARAAQASIRDKIAGCDVDVPVLNIGGGEIEPPPPSHDEADGLEKLWEFIDASAPLDTSQLQPFEGADVKWQKLIGALVHTASHHASVAIRPAALPRRTTGEPRGSHGEPRGATGSHGGATGKPRGSTHALLTRRRARSRRALVALGQTQRTRRRRRRRRRSSTWPCCSSSLCSPRRSFGGT